MSQQQEARLLTLPRPGQVQRHFVFFASERPSSSACESESSKGFEPREDVRLRFPDRIGVGGAIDFARLQGLPLHRQVDLDVAVGCRRAGMPEPAANPRPGTS